ncbi:MAG: hypothetical protein AAFW81_01010 [Pseudomonadota bacterium]
MINGKPLLWIDDDVRYLRPQVKNLQDEEITVEVERNVDQGRAKVMNSEGAYAGVILDVMMSPGEAYRNIDNRGGLITGLLFVREMHMLGLLASLKITVLSHRNDVGAEEEIKSLGVDYCHKADHAGIRIVDFVRDQFGG